MTCPICVEPFTSNRCPHDERDVMLHLMPQVAALTEENARLRAALEAIGAVARGACVRCMDTEAECDKLHTHCAGRSARAALRERAGQPSGNPGELPALAPVPHGHCGRCPRCGSVFAAPSGCTPWECSLGREPLRTTCVGCGAPYEAPAPAAPALPPLAPGHPMITRDLGNGWTLTTWEGDMWGPSLENVKRDIEVDLDSDGDLRIEHEVDGCGTVSVYIPVAHLRALLDAHDERARRAGGGQR